MNNIQRHYHIQIKPGDIILSIALLIVSLMCMWMIIHGKTSGEEADIYLDGKLVQTVRLNKNQNIELVSTLGEINIHVNNHKIWIHQVACPDQTCKKMGKITKTGETIVCVPNKLVIVIKGKRSYQLDALSE